MAGLSMRRPRERKRGDRSSYFKVVSVILANCGTEIPLEARPCLTSQIKQFGETVNYLGRGGGEGGLLPHGCGLCVFRFFQAPQPLHLLCR